MVNTTQRARRRKAAGFTLIELMVVVTIIGILAGVAVLQVQHGIRKAKETALKQDLATMRKAIDEYFADKQKYPSSLQELVDARYMRRLPPNPITNSVDDWEPVMADTSQEDPGSDPAAGDDFTAPGIVDVKCGPNVQGQTVDEPPIPYTEL